MYWNKKYEYLGAPAEVLERQPDGDFFVYLLSRASAHASVQIEISHLEHFCFALLMCIVVFA